MRTSISSLRREVECGKFAMQFAGGSVVSLRGFNLIPVIAQAALAAKSIRNASGPRAVSPYPANAPVLASAGCLRVVAAVLCIRTVPQICDAIVALLAIFMVNGVGIDATNHFPDDAVSLIFDASDLAVAVSGRISRGKRLFACAAAIPLIRRPLWTTRVRAVHLGCGTLIPEQLPCFWLVAQQLTENLLR